MPDHHALVRPMTFLLTDIEGSSRLHRSLGDRYRELLADHHRIIRRAIAGRGREVKAEADAFLIVFERAADAVLAAERIQLGLVAQPWPDDLIVRVRIGVHTGVGIETDGQLAGMDVYRAARIAAAAHGGQVVLSDPTRREAVDLFEDRTISVRALGEHRLNDLERPERLWQLVVPGLADTFPPLRTPSARIEILPTTETTFVGRETEVMQLLDALRHARLVTLTGPAGIGKTRLAVEAAQTGKATLPDGVAFVALAPIVEPGLVATAIRLSFGLPEMPGRSAVDTVVDALAGRELLLILDGFEQVAARRVVTELLSRSERLRIVITSRTVLRLPGEHELAVQPLPAPVGGSSADPLASERVRLFTERSLARPSSVTVSEEELASAVALCDRLDGVPLAIELVAARAWRLDPNEIVAGLDSRSAAREAVRDAIAWSHDLLEPEHQILFRRLGVFVGGWTLTDAEAVASETPTATGNTLDRDAVLGGLDVLSAHALVQRLPGGGEPRYAMHGAVREAALARLGERGERDDIERRHAFHFSDLAIRVAPNLAAHGASSTDRLQQGLDNLRAMLRWSARPDRLEHGLRAAGALARFWESRGLMREGRRWLEQLLGIPGGDTTARADALAGLGLICHRQGDFDGAWMAFEEALRIQRALGHRRRIARALHDLAPVAVLRGDLAGGRALYREARDRYLALGDEYQAAVSALGAASTRELEGDFELVVPVVEKLLSTFRRVGDDRWRLNSALLLARSLMPLGRLDRAGRLIDEALELATRNGRDASLVASALDEAGLFASARGDHERAVRLSGVVHAQRDRARDATPDLVARVRDGLAPARHAVGEAQVQRWLGEGRAMDVDAAVAYAVEGLRAGEPAEAGV